MESKFTGGLLGQIGIGILQFLLIVFTIGIATPWAVCIKESWYANHTIIDGRRLIFDGTGGQLFGEYILWVLLTLVTIGIFALWLPIKMQRWVTSHTHVAGIVM